MRATLSVGKAQKRAPRIEARSVALTAHGSVLGSAPTVSVQLTPNWQAPAIVHAVGTNTGNSRLRSALFALCPLLGRLLRLLLLLEQEDLGSQVVLGRIGLQLGAQLVMVMSLNMFAKMILAPIHAQAPSRLTHQECHETHTTNHLL